MRARDQLHTRRLYRSNDGAGSRNLGICRTGPAEVMPVRKPTMRDVVSHPWPRHIALTGESRVPFPRNPNGVPSELCFPPSKGEETEPSPESGLKGDGFTAVLQHLVPKVDGESGLATHRDGDLFRGGRSCRRITDCEGLKLGWVELRLEGVAFFHCRACSFTTAKVLRIIRGDRRCRRR